MSRFGIPVEIGSAPVAPRTAVEAIRPLDRQSHRRGPIIHTILGTRR